MGNLKMEPSKKNNNVRYPESKVIKAKNTIRPAYHENYQGYRCRLCMIKENTISEPIQINDAKAAYKLVKDELVQSDREMMLSLLLTAQNTLIGVETVCIGSIQSCAFTPAEVFKGALLANAVSIILCHNHPSGNLEPSQPDLKMTTSMKEVGNLIGIKVLDHLIVSHEGYRSLSN